MGRSNSPLLFMTREELEKMAKEGWEEIENENIKAVESLVFKLYGSLDYKAQELFISDLTEHEKVMLHVIMKYHK